MSELPGVRRRSFLAGVGVAAVGLPAVGVSPAAADPFPDMPTASTTTTEDRLQMLWQLGIARPTLPARAEDPNRPPNIAPQNAADPEGNWTDSLGHFVTRADFGQWITYDDDTGMAGGSASPFGDYGPFSNPRYTDIDLLTTKDGSPVRTAEDWWTRRRPEILRDVRDNLYGHIPNPDRWPAISWSVGPVSTGTANGFDYQQRVVTGTIDTSSHPEVRNAPVIQGTLRTPLDRQGQPVPVIVTFGSAAGAWQFTAPHGYGSCGFNPGLLQPDSGGANLSSYLIGLVNKGNWRRPKDWGALAAWSWGISRLIDYFETDPEVDATRIGLQGHSRFGKATLVAAAYDQRIGAAFPSAAGALGTSLARRAWGESLELVSGADTEYHWVAGNIMRFAGELNPGTYWPRKVERLTVDAHSMMALIAPRVVLTNAGTDTPPGFGDAWTDPRGEYLSGRLASPVWELLGWPGQIVPEGTVFTSGPGESIGGTPPIDVAFIDGTVGWRRHHEGHTPNPDWPFFMQLATRHLNGSRPVVAPGQRFKLRPGRKVVGTVLASDPGGAALGNWQITGGTGAGRFAIDRATGRITIRHTRSPDFQNRIGYTLSVIVDNRSLTSKEETVVIEVGNRP
jgi:(4-O-methyl)-D-glucuronate---lignin esterase